MSEFKPTEFYKSMDIVELSYVDKSTEMSDIGLGRKFFYSEDAAMKFIENIQALYGETWFVIESADIYKEI